MTIAGDFKHAPTPPNPTLGGAAGLGILADQDIPTVAFRHHIQRSYADVPGARSSTEALIEQDLLKALEARYNQQTALRALGQVRWQQYPPRFPGDRALLTAEVTITARLHVVDTPNGHQE